MEVISHVFLSADSDFGTFNAPIWLLGCKNGIFFKFKVHEYLVKLLSTVFLTLSKDQSLL